VIAVNFDPSMFLAILPEILLVVLAGLVLVLDLFLPQERKGSLGWVTASGLFFIMALSLIFARPPAEPRLVWGGMVRQDSFGFVFTMLLLFGAAISSLMSIDYEKFGKRGEYYVLMLVSTLGMCFMASSSDLIMLYLAIETTSIPLYILAGLLIRDDKSTEAGFKYLLFGAMTSAIMLYGFSLLYGFSGTTNMYLIAEGVSAGHLSLAAVIGSLMLVLIGFGFKVSAVPLHFWAPDVYEGAPTPVTGFLSTASKAAGFAVLVRFLLVVFPAVTPEWRAIVAALSVATMTLGNLLALVQTNIKRMLAYSSIAHAGYMMIGVVAVTQLGATSVVFYLIAYLMTNLAAFGVVAVIGRVTGSDEMTAYYGLSRRAPGLSLILMVSFLSLAGMPPLGGFAAKFFVFAAAVNSQMIWLAIVGVLNSIIGLYYYLTVLKYVYLYPPPEEVEAVSISRSYALALGVLVVGIILIGTIFGPWVSWATAAAKALF